MGLVILSDKALLNQVGVKCVDGVEICSLHKIPIQVVLERRSIHEFSDGGTGKVRVVLHEWCRNCRPDYSVPKPGTPIKQSDLDECQ